MDDHKSDNNVSHINSLKNKKRRRSIGKKKRRNRLFSDEEYEQMTNDINQSDHEDDKDVEKDNLNEENETDIENQFEEEETDSSENNLQEDSNGEKDDHQQKNNKKKNNPILFNKISRKKDKEQKRTRQDEKSEDQELSPEELHKRKKLEHRKRQKRIQIIIITSLILIIVMFLLYMFTPLSRISNVEIKGNKNVSTNEIKKELKLNSGERMYTFSKNKAISNLKDITLIKDVEIKKQLPNTLKVNITENQIVGVVKEKDDYIPIIEGNKELKNEKNKYLSKGPIIEGFKGDKKKQMIQALSNMDANVREMISEVSYEPEKNKQNRIVLYTKDGMQVVGNMKTIADKMKYYPQMSQSLSRDDSGQLSTKGYIDLSVGASFIPFNSSSSTESQTDQNVTKSSQQATQAKTELQNVLNKINNESKKNN